MTHSDLNLWLRLSEIGELANLRDTVLKYRLHADGISGQKRSLQRGEGKKPLLRRGNDGKLRENGLMR
ncbi:MAG: hypothetical protein BRC59_04310 [Cyanobacteria bacterium SW_4_48_29]|nr:MAG: hypothetical protein BRC48_08825 [Cyanobacteria bacterium QS_9_48_30]PSP30258.1 MAG: hypothetical protein BRC59_04310 [Cyanobacteria bacterium SW_4_48_29]